MATVTVKGGIYWDTDKHADISFGRWRFFPMAAHEKKPTNFGSMIAVMPFDLTFDPPADFDPRGPELAALKARQTALQAEFTRSMTEIQSRINALQAIEMTEAA